MLIHWQSHQEYLQFLHETKVHLDSSQRTRLQMEFNAVREKLSADSLLAMLTGCFPDSLPPLLSALPKVRSKQGSTPPPDFVSFHYKKKLNL